MANEFALSLLIYSGRENPTVSISETEFNSVLSSIKKQQKLSNYKFYPNLGDVGFSLYSLDTTIDVYIQVSTIETKSKTTHFSTNSETLNKAYDLFFSSYKGRDLKDLKAMVKYHLFGR